jgi:hypothetical protein
VTQDFSFPATGWLRDLSQGAREEIGRRFPALPVDEISREVGYYLIGRDAMDTDPEPEEARQMLRGLQKQARELHDVLQPMTLGPLETFIGQAAVKIPIKAPIALKELRDALLYFAAAFSKATTFIPEGRRRSPRERLVRVLVGILREAGEPINARPKGALCTVVDIVLRDVGEKPTDVRRIVGPVVQALENSPKASATVSKRPC